MSVDQKVTLFGWRWVASSKVQLLEHLESHLIDGRAQLLTISTANPEQVMLAQQNKQFFQTVAEEFDLVLPDGEGIVLASRLLNNQTQDARIVERLAGVEIVAELLSSWNQIRGPILVIGGRGYQDSTIGADSNQLRFQEIQKLADFMPKSKTNNSILWLPAYADAEQPNPGEEELVEGVIKKLKPKLVFVALGAPQQEFWVAQHKQLLKDSGVKIVMVVGGAFDMLTGKVSRAPRLLRQLKLEWFWRLLQEPSRWRRQLALLSFINHVIRLRVM